MVWYRCHNFCNWFLLLASISRVVVIWYVFITLSFDLSRITHSMRQRFHRIFSIFCHISHGWMYSILFVFDFSPLHNFAHSLFIFIWIASVKVHIYRSTYIEHADVTCKLTMTITILYREMLCVRAS